MCVAYTCMGIGIPWCVHLMRCNSVRMSVIVYIYLFNVVISSSARMTSFVHTIVYSFFFFVVFNKDASFNVVCMYNYR